MITFLFITFKLLSEIEKIFKYGNRLEFLEWVSTIKTKLIPTITEFYKKTDDHDKL